MLKISTKDYVFALSAERHQGFRDGYAAAWEEISKIVKEAAIKASLQAAVKEENSHE